MPTRMPNLDRYLAKLHEFIDFHHDLGFLRLGAFAGASTQDTVGSIEQSFADRQRAILLRHRNADEIPPGPPAWTNRNRTMLLEWMDRADQVDIDLYLLASEPGRLWTFDQECVYDHHTYAAAVMKLSDIVPAFRPSSIKEAWIRYDDPRDHQVEWDRIELTFDTGGVSHRFWIGCGGDYMNLGWIAGVNAILAHPTHQIERQGHDQDVTMIWLDAGQRARLVERGWCFEPLTPTQGVWQFPEPAVANLHKELPPEWLFLRGAERYRAGDVIGAWEDWEKATREGLPNIHARIKGVTQSTE